jgi:hypothetical protein
MWKSEGKMTAFSNNENPECFGELNTVFPKGDDDLRHTPESCMQCPVKTGCLREAMAGLDGLRAREEFTDRAYKSGRIGFMQRWIRKKEFNRKIRKKRKNSV